MQLGLHELSQESAPIYQSSWKNLPENSSVGGFILLFSEKTHKIYEIIKKKRVNKSIRPKWETRSAQIIPARRNFFSPFLSNLDRPSSLTPLPIFQ